MPSTGLNARTKKTPIQFHSQSRLRTSKDRPRTPSTENNRRQKAMEQFPTCRYYFSHFNSRCKYSKYLDLQPNTLFVSAYIKRLNWIKTCVRCSACSSPRWKVTDDSYYYWNYFFYKIALTKVNITSITITVMEFSKNKHLVSVSGNNTTHTTW